MDRIRQLLGKLTARAEHVLARANRRLGGIPLLLKQTFDSYNAHDGTFVAGAMAYYFLFALFPLVLALIAIGSLFFETGRARAAAIEFISRALPAQEATVARNIDLVLAQRGPISVVAALGLIYSASGLFGVLLAVVNRAWACPAGRPSYIQRLLAVALVLALVPFYFLSASVTTALQAVRGAGFLVGLGMAEVTTLFTVLSLLLSIALTAGLFLILYWKLPATRVRFADAGPAALAASLTWEAARQFYAWYLSLFTRFTLVYGSVAAIIGLLSWLYLTAFIILLGVELSAQIAERRGRGPSACKT